MKEKTLLSILCEVNTLLNNRTQCKEEHIYFAIPLKSKQVSKNWKVVQENLKNTLQSILNNTKKNFTILVAGHEKPSIEELNHKKVIWLPVNFSTPKSQRGFNKDKNYKLNIIGQYLKEKKKSGYIMPFDADDIVHYRFVEYVNTLPISDAYFINKGIMLNEKHKEIWLLNNFYMRCGSGGLYYFSYNSFPASYGDRNNFIYKLIGNHQKAIKLLQKHKKNITMINHAIVLRRFGHGDNNMLLKGTLKHNVSAIDFGTYGVNVESVSFLDNYFKTKQT